MTTHLTIAATHSVKTGFLRALAIIFLVDIKKAPKYLADLEDYGIDAEALVKKIGIRPSTWTKLCQQALAKKIDQRSDYPPYWEVADQIVEKSATLKTELEDKRYHDFALAWAKWMTTANEKSKDKMLSLLHIADPGTEGQHQNKEDDGDIEEPKRRGQKVTPPAEDVQPQSVRVVPTEPAPDVDPLEARFDVIKSKGDERYHGVYRRCVANLQRQILRFPDEDADVRSDSCTWGQLQPWWRLSVSAEGR